ncbi:nuclear transport factor 2 family protein [Sphingomonas aestuarii]|jgi:ketosteroid isomerase-like protein
MRFGLIISAAAVVAISTAPAAAQLHPPASAASAQLEPEVREAATVVDAFHQALQSGDKAAALASLAPDALVYEGGRAERDKAEYASHHLSADAAFAKATKRSVTRRAGHAAGNMAWIASEAKTSGTYRDRAINSMSTETMVLRRTGDAWQIVHIHWSSADVK